MSGVGNRNVVSMYPLSPMQEGMLFQALREPQSSAYFNQLSFVIQGSLHEAHLEKSLSLLMERHDIFRTVFVSKLCPGPADSRLMPPRPAACRRRPFAEERVLSACFAAPSPAHVPEQIAQDALKAPPPDLAPVTRSRVAASPAAYNPGTVVALSSPVIRIPPVPRTVPS